MAALPALLTLPKPTRPFVIGVAGGTASGKTTVCEMIIEQLEQQAGAAGPIAILINQDSFYKPLSPDVDASNYNFDHPDAFDFELIEQTLRKLLDNEPVDIPLYDFKTHSRLEETRTLRPAKVVLFEGILSLYTKELLELFDMRLFVDCDSDERLARRVLRDIEHRGRDLESILRQYVQFVKPSFEDFILPTKKYADVIIPRGADNLVAIDLIVQHIREASMRESRPRSRPVYAEPQTPTMRPH